MSDDVAVKIALRGAREFARDAKMDAAAIRGVGTSAEGVTARVRSMGGVVSAAGRGLGIMAARARYAAYGVGALGIAGAKMGLAFNAQVEGARLRFGLFTSDVDGLMNAVQRIDKGSGFGLGELADAAAMLGNSGVQDVPGTLEGIANAAAASGKGADGLGRIALAIGQIQAKGRLSQEELNQILEAGGPGAQQAIQREFNLTADQLGNLGAQGLDAGRAIRAITREWTSGKMAGAAKRQLSSLAGQWDLLTGNVRLLSGALTEGLAGGLKTSILPAINATVEAVTEIFGREGLSNEQKIRQARDAIRRTLKPIAQDIIRDIQDADLAGKLDREFERAMSKIAVTAVTRADDVVGAFVKGWLSAGPWAKLASGAWLAGKLGLTKAAMNALFTGKAGGAGGAAGRLGATPVYVVNWAAGGAPPVIAPTGGPASKPQRGTARKVAGWGVVALAAATGYQLARDLARGTPLARYSGREGWGNLLDDITPNIRARQPSPVPAWQPSGSIPPPGYGNQSRPITVISQIDGKTLSRTTVTTDMIEQGRANAMTAARR